MSIFNAKLHINCCLYIRCDIYELTEKTAFSIFFVLIILSCLLQIGIILQHDYLLLGIHLLFVFKANFWSLADFKVSMFNLIKESFRYCISDECLWNILIYILPQRNGYRSSMQACFFVQWWSPIPVDMNVRLD